MTIYNSTVSYNTATRQGGGIYNNFGTMTIYNSIISYNEAILNGGGILNSAQATTMTINNSTISYNEAGNVGGGFVNLFGLRTTISNSTISYNEADNNGGGILNARTMTLSNSTVSNNTAVRDGGGIFNDDLIGLTYGEMIINNSTVSNNTAVRDGGGIYNNDILGINNSTISNNSSNNSGEGIYNDNTISTVTITNSIIANHPTNGNCRTVDMSGGNNLSDDVTCIITADVSINLAGLANNGGPTETHALLVGSSAIDGSNASATTSDQRGAAVVTTRDIGAFEYQGTVPTVTVGTASANTILEVGGTASITVNLANLATGDSLIVMANIVGGNAIRDTDYTITPSLTFNADGSQNFIITALTDALVETDETLIVSFSLIGAGAISGNGNQTVTITNVNPLTFTKVFAPRSITVGDTSTLTFTIDNTVNNVLSATALDFTDSLPAGMTIATSANASTTCTGGTVTAVVGTSIVSYTGGDIGANSSCTIQVDVVGETAGTLSNVSGDLTSNLGNSGTASADLIVANVVADVVENIEPNIDVFDPAISKIGFLVPGQTGVVGEQLEWIVTVSNTGNVVGNNVIVTDTLIDALQVDSINAPGGITNINGQIATVTYPIINVGETFQFSIFTTVLEGVTVNNTVCIDADNQGTEECVTSFAITQLPETGETPFWHTNLIGILALLGISSLFIFRQLYKPQS